MNKKINSRLYPMPKGDRLYAQNRKTQESINFKNNTK